MSVVEADETTDTQERQNEQLVRSAVPLFHKPPDLRIYDSENRAQETYHWHIAAITSAPLTDEEIEEQERQFQQLIHQKEMEQRRPRSENTNRKTTAVSDRKEVHQSNPPTLFPPPPHHLLSLHHAIRAGHQNNAGTKGSTSSRGKEVPQPAAPSLQPQASMKWTQRTTVDSTSTIQHPQPMDQPLVRSITSGISIRFFFPPSISFSWPKARHVLTASG